MDEISCFNNIYSDMFSLEFDNLFSTIDFKSFESKENETLTEIKDGAYFCYCAHVLHITQALV